MGRSFNIKTKRQVWISQPPSISKEKWSSDWKEQMNQDKDETETHNKGRNSKGRPDTWTKLKSLALLPLQKKPYSLKY